MNNQAVEILTQHRPKKSQLQFNQHPSRAGCRCRGTTFSLYVPALNYPGCEFHTFVLLVGRASCKAGSTNLSKFDTSLSSNPDKARGGECLLETLASRGAAGTRHEDLQPNTNPSQLRLAAKCHMWSFYVELLRARKLPLRGRGCWGDEL